MILLVWSTIVLLCSLSHAFPTMNATPIFQPRFDSDSNIFYLGCDWADDDFVNDDATTTMFAQWFQEDQLVTEREVGRNDTYREIPSSEFAGLAYGKKVQCGVVACFTDRCNESRSPVAKSDEFRLGIKVLYSSLKLKEGGIDEAITLASNFPPSVFCDFPSSDKACSIFVAFHVSEDKSDIRCPEADTILPQLVLRGSSGDACGVRLTNDNWSGIHRVDVRAVADEKTDGDQDRDVVFKAKITPTNTIDVGSVKLTVIDNDRISICQSINDPHMITFDGQFYNNFLLGEFILYRHQAKPYEVRAFFRKCNKRASCNCAVVVRVGNCTVRVDRCGSKKVDNGKDHPLTVDMFTEGEVPQGMTVLQFDDGKKLEILLPSTTKVIITTMQMKKTPYINVMIQASSNDFGQTEGLCGMYDKNICNDFTDKKGELLTGNSRSKEFSKSWRVEEDDDSIYEGYSGANTVERSGPNTVELEPTSVPFCACANPNAPSCGEDTHLANCLQELRNITGGKDITQRLATKASIPNAEKVVFDYDREYVFDSPSWPVNGYDEISATSECEQHIAESPSSQACLAHVDIDIEAVITGCVEDIQIMGTLEFLPSAVENVNMRCALHLHTNTSLWVEEGQQVKLLPDVFDKLCPGDCSDNGRCSHGRCTCAEDFIGADCSMSRTVPPVISEVRPKSCDVKSEDCAEITIIGGPFVDDEGLACVLQPVDNVDETDAVRPDAQIEVEATFISFETITCTPPSTDSFKVSVKDSTRGPSNAVTRQVYDAACFSGCDGEYCVLDGKYCFIDNVCYTSLEKRKMDESFICDPSKSLSSWTNMKGSAEKMAISVSEIVFFLFLRYLYGNLV